MWLFTGNKKKAAENAAPKVSDTISTLRQTLATMEKRIQLLESKIEKAGQEAKEKVKSKDRRGALVALKRRKLYTQQLESVQNQQMTLEQQCIDLEGAQLTLAAVKAMKQGVNTQKDAYRSSGMQVENIEELQEDIEEMRDQMTELNDLFAQNALGGTEDELEDEFAALETMMAEEDQMEKELEAGGRTAPSVAESLEAGKLPSMARKSAQEALNLKRQKTDEARAAREAEDKAAEAELEAMLMAA